MNGTNGSINGNNQTNGNSNGVVDWSKGIWSIGLINGSHKYLTAETFGYKINANGISLKKKQTWKLEPAGHADAICLKSHLDRYLAVDQYGNVTCDAQEKEHGSFFEIAVNKQSGKWTLRNISRGYYLGADPDKLVCTSKGGTSSEIMWSIHLGARPQVTLKSVGRKRYAHLAENHEEIYVDANVPWGADTLFTLEFRENNYALHTCNNKYLHQDGVLQPSCDGECLFSIEYHHGQMALRDQRGLYLAPIGSKAVLKTRSHTVTKDELFILEDSFPQAAFVAALNSKYVSVKQGVDVTANQDEISNFETFQLEFEPSTKRWYIRTMQDKYWTLETGGGIQASSDKRSSNSLFDFEWQLDGSVGFRGNNGKYVGAKRSGHLYANCDALDEEISKFYFYLINRPILVLKCEQGYVGYKSNSPKLECNKASYETIQVIRDDKGVVNFKGNSGFWTVVGDEVSSDGDKGTNFYLELREPTKVVIKTDNGFYLNSEKNGVFRVSQTDNPTKWEF